MLPTKLRSKLVKRPLLQVAIDLIDLSKALNIAEKVWSVGADILEVGTPLIKSEGIRAIKEFRRSFPDAIILADMKTADVGALEVELAWISGADITTVLGTSSDEVIEAAIQKAQELGIAVEIDMINHPNPISRIKEIEKMSPDIIGLHVAIDVQKKRKLTVRDQELLVKEAARVFKGPIAVAGGLRPETIPYMVKAGAKIVVVGSAITKASNPQDATKDCLNALMLATQ